MTGPRREGERGWDPLGFRVVARLPGVAPEEVALELDEPATAYADPDRPNR